MLGLKLNHLVKGAPGGTPPGCLGGCVGVGVWVCGCVCVCVWGGGSQYKDVVLQKYMYRDPHVKDKTVFNMGISIPQREGLYIETGPRTFSTYVQIPHAGVLELQLSGALVAHELRSNIKTVFPYMGNSIIKIRWPWDSLFFIMGIPVRHLYIETATWILDIQFADNSLKICLFRWQRYLKVTLFSFYPP